MIFCLSCSPKELYLYFFSVFDNWIYFDRIYSVSASCYFCIFLNPLTSTLFCYSAKYLFFSSSHNDLISFCKTNWSYLRDGESSSGFHLLVYSPSVNKSRASVRLQPGVWNSLQLSHRVTDPWVFQLFSRERISRKEKTETWPGDQLRHSEMGFEYFSKSPPI